MAAKSWKSKDILLLLLYAPFGEHEVRSIVGRTRLQKLMFLFEEEYYKRFRFADVVPADALPQFEPWKFGPFSKQVLSDIEFFKSIGFVDTANPASPPSVEEVAEYAEWLETDVDDSGPAEYEGEQFTLSERGASYVEKNLWISLNDAQRAALADLKSRFTNAPLYSVLEYVYTKYPESAARSEIARDILGGSGSGGNADGQ